MTDKHKLKQDGWSDKWIEAVVKLDNLYPNMNFEPTYCGMDGLHQIISDEVDNKIIACHIDPDYEGEDDSSEFIEGHMNIYEVINEGETVTTIGTL